VVEPDVPPSRWVLSEEGRGRCVALADHLARFEPSTIYASAEPKATETAKIVSEKIGVGLRVFEGLEEHHREDAPFFQDPGDFDDAVRRLFDNPNELVYGS
jgi:broad specificity phosphatase PhoE